MKIKRDTDEVSKKLSESMASVCMFQEIEINTNEIY